MWEIVETLKGTGLTGEQAMTATCEWGSLAPGQVRLAIRYYAECPDEIDGRVRPNVEEADAAEAAWRRERDALA